MSIRVEKDLALSLVRQLAPDYLEFFRDIQKPDGWRTFSMRVGETRNKLKLDSYVILYGNDVWILNALALALLGEQGAKELNAELETPSPDEQQNFLDELTNDAINNGDDWVDEIFPDSPAKQEVQLAKFQALSDEEKAASVNRAQHLFAFVFANFYNCISVMVHGKKLTSLVPKAIAGDRVAFGKAIHIDKSLLHAHPDFRAIHELAQSNQDQERDFLRNIGNNLQASPTKGRINYPGAYMVFAMLESLGWLNGLSHEEILNVCDEAGLDRWESRIEDVNYLTKRLGAYRRMQKMGGLSMR